MVKNKTVSSTAPLLDVRDLAMHFPVRGGVFLTAKNVCRAVDGVSLQIMPGETLGLVGESGCGKSTLGKCIVRLLDPTHGSINFDGHDLAQLPRRHLKPLRREVQMIFQDPGTPSAKSSPNPFSSTASAPLANARNESPPFSNASASPPTPPTASLLSSPADSASASASPAPSP